MFHLRCVFPEDVIQLIKTRNQIPEGMARIREIQVKGRKLKSKKRERLASVALLNQKSND